MLFVSLIRWWYGPGWLDQLKLVQRRLDRTADFFSIELSLRSFFKPFRQIDAEGVRKGSLQVIFRAMFDQLFSRVIGSFARGFIIILGGLALALEVIIGGIRLLLWPLVPAAPFLAVPLTFSGWIPWL